MTLKNLCPKFNRFQCLLTAFVWCVQISAHTNHEKVDSVNVMPFSKIMVIGNQKTSLTFCQENHYALTIAGCNREDVNIEYTNDSTLLIYPNSVKSPESIMIKVYAPEWNNIFASLIENIQTNGTLKADKLQVDASLVKTMDLSVQVNSLDLKAKVEKCSISGSCEQTMIDFDGSPSLQSILQAKDLQSKVLHIKSGIHSKVFAQTSKSLWLQDGFLSEITIYGSPSDIRNDTKSCQIHILPKE